MEKLYKKIDKIQKNKKINNEQLLIEKTRLAIED